MGTILRSFRISGPLSPFFSSTVDIAVDIAGAVRYVGIEATWIEHGRAIIRALFATWELPGQKGWVITTADSVKGERREPTDVELVAAKRLVDSLMIHSCAPGRVGQSASQMKVGE